MKTDGNPLHGSYFDLAAAKHPDLESPSSGQRRTRRLMNPRGGRFGVLPVVLSGALAGVAWLVIALKPEENVRLAAAEAMGLPASESSGQGPVVQDATAREAPAEAVSLVTTAPAASPRQARIPESTVPRSDAGRSIAATSRPVEQTPVPAANRREEQAPAAGVLERRETVPAVDRVTEARSPAPGPVEAPVVVPARKIFAPAPEYPAAARDAGEEGTVVVEAEIDATGAVTGASVVRGRSPALDAAALAALESWRFEPARLDDTAIGSSYRVGITFTLSDGEEAAPPGPFEVGAEVLPPRRLAAPLPAYPDDAWVHGIAGDVLVRAIIDENGDVKDVEVVKGLPYGMTEAALEAIRRWKFAPATRNGRPVAVYRNLSVRFEG